MSYYKLLCEINKFVCNGKTKIRENSIQYLQIIYNAINKVIYNSKTDEEILTNSMQVAALIKLFQPFYDGNHKTGLILFGNLIRQKGFNFDFQNALIDMTSNKLNIPTLYNEKELIGNFDEWYKYISKEKIL